MLIISLQDMVDQNHKLYVKLGLNQSAIQPLYRRLLVKLTDQIPGVRKFQRKFVHRTTAKWYQE